MNRANLERFIRPLVRRVGAMLARGRATITYDDGPLQRCQVTLEEGEVRDRVEHPQNYGFTSRAKAGAKAFVGRIGGKIDHTIVLMVDDHRFRLRGLAEGEVAMYDDLGSKVVFRRGGKIEIHAAGDVEVVAAGQCSIDAPAGATLTAPLTTIDGDLDVTGSIGVTGNVISQANVIDSGGPLGYLRDRYNIHTHNENGTGGGITNPPNQPA